MLNENPAPALTATAEAAPPAADTAHTATTAPVALKAPAPADDKPRIVEDTVIEEVSIDGMCGVY